MLEALVYIVFNIKSWANSFFNVLKTTFWRGNIFLLTVFFFLFLCVALQFTLEDSRSTGTTRQTSSSADDSRTTTTTTTGLSRQADRILTESPERRISRPFSSNYSNTLHPTGNFMPMYMLFSREKLKDLCNILYETSVCVTTKL